SATWGSEKRLWNGRQPRGDCDCAAQFRRGKPGQSGGGIRLCGFSRVSKHQGPRTRFGVAGDYQPAAWETGADSEYEAAAARPFYGCCDGLAPRWDFGPGEPVAS